MGSNLATPLQGENLQQEQSYSTSNSADLYESAQELLPAGVNSPVRAFQAVGGRPIFFEKAQGAELFDVDGNRYIDFVGSWGPLIVGHAHPHVVSAIQRAASRGTSFGAPHSREIDLASAVRESFPTMEMLRFVNSGTEATMSALRLARGATQRDLILKFAGCYHGHADHLLVKAGSGVATFSLPDSAGVPADITKNTLVAPFNDLNAVKEVFSQHGDSIAAIIVEPVAGNIGVVPPKQGFLAGLRTISREHGSLLIFDEVMTGFRVHKGGACALYGVEPDLICLAKVIGGGLPVGAYGGRRETMEQIAPLGPVYQAGTLSGNPLAMAAGIATLSLLTDSLYVNLEARSEQLARGLREVLRSRSIPAHINRVGSMLSLFFTDSVVETTDDALSTDRNLYSKLYHLLLRRGVYLPPSPLEAWFVSSMHTEEMITNVLEKFTDSVKEL